MELKLKRNESLTIQEIEEENIKLEVEYKKLFKQQIEAEKKARGLLWLLWLFPIIGWSIYVVVYSRRKQSEKYLNSVIPIKKQLTMIEIQKMYNKKLINEKSVEKEEVKKD